MADTYDEDMITIEAQNRTIHTLNDVIDNLKTELKVTNQENAKQEALQFAMKEQINDAKCGTCHKVSDFKICARCMGEHHMAQRKKQAKFNHCNNVSYLQKCTYMCSHCKTRGSF